MLTWISFFAAILATIFSRRDAKPSVPVYCSATLPILSITLQAASLTPSVGNSSGAGIPPAKEITSGFAVSANKALISEPFNRFILFANLTAIGSSSLRI